LSQDLAKSNLISLAYYDAGARNFYTKKPVKTLDDLKGMKIRVIQNDILIDAFKRLGVSPTPMSASEVHGGLQTGVIDGGENNMSTYVADGLYEVAKNFTQTGHLRIPGILYMSKMSWDKLSADDQKIIADAAKESEKTQLAEFDKYEAKAADKVKANGNQIITLAPADLQAIRDKVKPVYDKYQDKFGSFFKEIDAVRKK
jgi:TRAP-type C4-dicarboxylate transport system substrate-binding protein